MKFIQKYWSVILIGGVLLIGIMIRLYAFKTVTGETGGDVYDFLWVAKGLLNGQNPFLLNKRLPFYPLLLTPGILFFDNPIIWSRIVSIVSSLLAGGVIIFLRRKFRLSILEIALSLFLLLINVSFLVFSIRPLSHALYSFLFMLSIYLYFKATSSNERRDFILLGISIGCLSMTRNEGFFAAVVICAFSIFPIKKIETSFKKCLPLFVSYGLIVAPFLLNNLYYHHKLFYSDYLTGEGLYPPHNMQEFVNNLVQNYHSFLSIWGNIDFIKISYIAYFFIFIGLGVMIRRLRFQSLILFFLIFSQVIISIWFQPSARYLQQLIPLLSIFLAVGIISTTQISYLKKPRFIPIFFISGVLAIYFLFYYTQFSKFETVHAIAGMNYDAYRWELSTKAARIVKDFNRNTVVAGNRDYGAAFVFYNDKKTAFYKEPDTKDEEKFLKQNNAKYLVRMLPTEKYSYAPSSNKFEIIERDVRQPTIESIVSKNGLEKGAEISFNEIPKEFVISFSELEALKNNVPDGIIISNGDETINISFTVKGANDDEETIIDAKIMNGETILNQKVVFSKKDEVAEIWIVNKTLFMISRKNDVIAQAEALPLSLSHEEYILRIDKSLQPLAAMHQAKISDSIIEGVEIYKIKN